MIICGVGGPGVDVGTNTGGAGGNAAGMGVDGGAAGGGGVIALMIAARICGLGAFGPDRTCTSSWFIVMAVTGAGARPGGGGAAPRGAGGGATGGGVAFKALRPSAGPAFCTGAAL
ncbi:MAG: hypothetical protein ACT4O6_02200 [Reyranella sp.]